MVRFIFDLFVFFDLFKKGKEVSFQISVSKRNENEISRIIEKLEAFTNYKVKFRYFWKTRKVRSLFVLTSLTTKQTLFIWVLAHVVNFI